jgi:hypothetical protein
MENTDIKLKNSISYFLKDILYLNTGQRMMTYSDMGCDTYLIDELINLAQKNGIYVDVLWLDNSSELSEVIKIIIKKIKYENYNVILELSKQYFYPTDVWRISQQKGCRLYALGAIKADSFIRCIGEVDQVKMKQFGMQLYKLLRKARLIQIYTEAGTNITCRMNTSHFITALFEQLSKVIQLLKRLKTKLKGPVAISPNSTLLDEEKNITTKVDQPVSPDTQTNNLYEILKKLKNIMKRSMILVPTGILLKKRPSATFMGGQLTFNGIPSTIEGTVVIDGFLWPPEEIGLINKPIILRIKKGVVTDIEGNHPQALTLTKFLENRDKGVKHLCIGFNPGCTFNGDLIEAERVFGCINIGIGKYPFHVDGVSRSPSMIADGATVLKNNSFTHETLSSFDQRFPRAKDDNSKT